MPIRGTTAEDRRACPPAVELRWEPGYSDFATNAPCHQWGQTGYGPGMMGGGYGGPSIAADNTRGGYGTRGRTDGCGANGEAMSATETTREATDGHAADETAPSAAVETDELGIEGNREFMPQAYRLFTGPSPARGTVGGLIQTKFVRWSAT